jgi:hypothetical protein
MGQLYGEFDLMTHEWYVAGLDYFVDIKTVQTIKFLGTSTHSSGFISTLCPVSSILVCPVFLATLLKLQNFMC